jgi:hypothetical protein
VSIAHNQVLDRRYPGQITRLEIDEDLASLDVLRAELQPLQVERKWSV